MTMKMMGAILDGAFAPRVRMKVERLPPHLITDGNVLTTQNQLKTRARLLRRYSALIGGGVAEIKSAAGDEAVWALWLQGEANAPDLVKACMASCRGAIGERKLVVLTEDTIEEYVDLPGYVFDKRASGAISAAQFSDLIRADLLSRHGGLWADATCLFTEPIPDFVWESPLFVFKALDLARSGTQPIVCSSWFIRAAPGQRIIRLTRDLMIEYWKDARILEDYFLFHILFALAAERYPEDWDAVPTFDNHSPHVMGFELGRPYDERRWNQLLAMSPVHKLTRHVDYSKDAGSVYAHIVRMFAPHD